MAFRGLGLRRGGRMGLHYSMSKVPRELAQIRTLKAFDELCEALGSAPSIRQVSRALGLHPLGAQHTIGELIDQGDILAKQRTVRKPTRLSAAGRKRLERANQEK